MKPAHILFGLATAFICNSTLSQTKSAYEKDSIEKTQRDFSRVINQTMRFSTDEIENIKEHLETVVSKIGQEEMNAHDYLDYCSDLLVSDARIVMRDEHYETIKTEYSYLMTLYTQTATDELLIKNVTDFITLIDQDLKKREIVKVPPVEAPSNVIELSPRLRR